jgi:ABC-type lipoprotein export system ATPase subunit
MQLLRTMFHSVLEHELVSLSTCGKNVLREQWMLGIAEKSNEPVRRLSGGQQRRVATARTLAQRPQLMLADEFLGELDHSNVEIVFKAVQTLVENGTAVIMVEHHDDNAQLFATRIWNIKDETLEDFSLEEWNNRTLGGEEE